MRHLAAISVLLLLSPAAKADNWDTYAQWWNSHYYELDPKAFTNITCQADSSLLDEGLAELLAGHPSVVAAKELYTVSVSNTGDVQVTDPLLQLKPVTASAQVEVPLIQEMLQEKFATLAAGTDLDMKIVVQLYTPPDRKTEVIQEISIGPDATTMTKKELDMDSTSKLTFRGADLTGETTQNVKIGENAIHAQGSAKAHYDTVDGKYLMASEVTDSIQTVGARQIHAINKTTIDYQLISGIRFPKTARWTGQPGSDTQGYDNTVEFQDCKVTK
jgi:hypothetical protein